jgi:hypothetical protein
VTEPEIKAKDVALMVGEDHDTGESYLLIEFEIPFSFEKDSIFNIFFAWWCDYSINTSGLIKINPYFQRDNIQTTYFVLLNRKALDTNFSYPLYSGCVTSGRKSVLNWLERHLYVVPLLYILKKKAEECFTDYLAVTLSVSVDPECGHTPTQLIFSIAVQDSDAKTVMKERESFIDFVIDDANHRFLLKVVTDIDFVHNIPPTRTIYTVEKRPRPIDGLKLYQIVKQSFVDDALNFMIINGQSVSMWTVPDESLVEAWALEDFFTTRADAEATIKRFNGVPFNQQSRNGLCDHITSGSKWYNANEEWLVQEHYGMYVCVCCETLLGIFNSFSDAYNMGMRKSKTFRIFITQCVPEKEKMIHIYNVNKENEHGDSRTD